MPENLPQYTALIAAIVSAIVAILGIITKPFYERVLLSKKLETEFKFEERKKIREIISKNRVAFVNACEELRNRLRNLSKNWMNEHINVDGDFTPKANYFHSFVYKFLAVHSLAL